MTTPATFDTLAVIGNGIIGHGVSQVYAVAGKDVMLIGRSGESLGRAIDNIRSSLADFERHGLVTAEEADAAVGRIRTSTDLADAATAQLVIEAVTHDMPLKVDLFGQLDEICPQPTVLATSSGAPASDVHDRVRHRERVIATHFWYPPQLIPLVEVCASPETAPDVLAWTCDAMRACGKDPAVIDREIPGFIGNRLQFALLREAWNLWASGAASAEAIDACVRNSIGRRLGITGPIESADIGGIATMDSFARGLLPHLDTSPAPPIAVTETVDRGGIHDWSERDAEALRAARMEELFRWLAVDAAG
ncbi:MAG: 3-hydroxybutyryl-CoA dehydrogenase [Gaiellales bacterium]|jgi:3-hydroxybutyryl-CoA dehydrogenase|nr:3-hydroxybutyryl-CoA dehydrogenase [Gaiellales bacterium]